MAMAHHPAQCCVDTVNRQDTINDFLLLWWYWWIAPGAGGNTGKASKKPPNKWVKKLPQENVSLPIKGQLCDILEEFSGTSHFLTHPPSYKNNTVFFRARANTPACARALAHRHAAASRFHYQALFLQLHPGNSFLIQSKNLGSSEITWTCASRHRARIFPRSQDALSQVTISFSHHDSHWEPLASPELFQAWKSCSCTECFALFPEAQCCALSEGSVVGSLTASYSAICSLE